MAGGSIRLPSGTVVKIGSFTAHPKWKQRFPPDQPFFAEKYAEENLKGMHSRYSGRLDGASVTLHENGNVKMLTYSRTANSRGLVAFGTKTSECSYTPNTTITKRTA